MNGRAAWLDWVGLDGSEREDGEGEERGERGKVEKRGERAKNSRRKSLKSFCISQKVTTLLIKRAYLDFTRGRLSWPPPLPSHPTSNLPPLPKLKTHSVRT